MVLHPQGSFTPCSQLTATACPQFLRFSCSCSPVGPFHLSTTPAKNHAPSDSVQSSNHISYPLPFIPNQQHHHGPLSLSVVAPTQRAFSISSFLSSRASLSPTALTPAPWPNPQPRNIRVQAAAVTHRTLLHLEKQLQFTGEVESPVPKPSPLTGTSPAKSQSPSRRQTQVIHPRAQAHVGDKGNFCVFSTLQGLEQLPMSSGDAPSQFRRCE